MKGGKKTKKQGKTSKHMLIVTMGTVKRVTNHGRFNNKLSFPPKYKHIINLDHSNPDQNELCTQDKCLCAEIVSRWIQFASVLIDVFFICPRSFICDLGSGFLFLLDPSPDFK